MHRILRALTTLTLIGLFLSTTGQAWAYGEPVDGFPSYYERIIHVFTNQARANPYESLAGCSNCPDRSCFDTTPLSPLQYSLPHNYASRFHAQNLTETGCGMMHDSPCDLVSNIGDLYPGSCDGSASCACQGGSASCSGIGFSARLSLFGASARAENIAWKGDPLAVFNAWLWESTSDGTCSWSMSNGHRWNILSSNTSSLGVGGFGGYTVQDFGAESINQKILAGAHYPETGTEVEILVNWYDNAAPGLALVNIGGSCQPLSLKVGQSANGTYSADAQVSGCTRYYFIFEDSAGNEIHYPTTGSFGINCTEDWDSSRPAAGAGCSCTPDCSGRSCGDDGCGGSCGSCNGLESCVSFSCQCTHESCGSTCCESGQVCSGGACCNPNCSGLSCGDDGCGGSCGSCAADQICSAGSCVCPAGTADCGAGCVPLNTAANCGACGQVCGANEVCNNGSCQANCDAGLNLCSGACVNLSSDKDNCGGCGTTCSADQVCSSGSCTCPAGSSDCGAGCVPLNTAENCGSCGQSCEAGEVCSNGSCQGSCGDGLSLCVDACVNLDSDEGHCGSCGNACSIDKVCSSGACVCPSGSADCGAGCVALNTPENCGTCGQVCAADEVCSNGNCQSSCDEGLTLCSGSCVDLNSAPNHCGVCGQICTGECFLGECKYGDFSSSLDQMEADGVEAAEPLQAEGEGCSCQLKPGAASRGMLWSVFLAVFMILGMRRKKD